MLRQAELTNYSEKNLLTAQIFDKNLPSKVVKIRPKTINSLLPKKIFYSLILYDSMIE